MAQYPSWQGRSHVASSKSGQKWEEWASSFPAFSCSHHPVSTSCLVDLPILPAWPISVLLKYMIDRIQIILPHQMMAANILKVNFIFYLLFLSLFLAVFSPPIFFFLSLDIVLKNIYFLKRPIWMPRLAY